ncbi:MAG: UxaA family hydrolase [Dongiaceae bacterium]
MSGASNGAASPPAAIVLSPEDNVGVAVRTIARGAEVTGAEVAGAGVPLVASDEIPTGHKVALRPIAPGDKIVKFGVPVGSATKAIPAGAHVHMHNVKSDYLTNREDHFE